MNQLNVSAEEISKDAMFSVFPNPAAANITIEFKMQHSAVTGQLIDISGRTIKSYKWPGNISKMNLNLENTPSGIYLLQLNSESGSEAFRIVVE